MKSWKGWEYCEYTYHVLAVAKFLTMSSADHFLHLGQGHGLSNDQNQLNSQGKHLNKQKKLKIKHHSGLDSTQVRKFFKIKVLSEQQKGRVSESHWPKGRELYDLSLECFGCFGHNTRVPAIAISNIFLLSWQQTEPSSYTEDKHVSKPTMTSTSVLVHETWYRIHTGAKQTPVLFQKGMNIKIFYIWIKLRRKLNWNHLYFWLPRSFYSLKKQRLVKRSIETW